MSPPIRFVSSCTGWCCCQTCPCLTHTHTRTRTRTRTAVQVELSPGDVLYIPPFWFHYVEAVDASVSVCVVLHRGADVSPSQSTMLHHRPQLNVWSESAEQQLVTALEDAPLPFPAE